MPHTYAKEELEERYKKLPSVLKDAMFSPEVAEKMFEIGKKNGLTIEKTGFMAEETGFIILGLTQPREFVKILSDRLDTDRDTASKIASDINHAILFPLRETLKSAHDIEVGEAELHGPATDIAAVARRDAISRDTDSLRPATGIVPPSGVKPPAPVPPVSISMPLSSIPTPQKTPAPVPTPVAPSPRPTSPPPAIPGFIPPDQVEKIVAAEKAKRQMPPPAEIDLRGQKLPDAKHTLPATQQGANTILQQQTTSATGPRDTVPRERVLYPQQPAMSAVGPPIIPKQSPSIPQPPAQEKQQTKNEIDLRQMATATPPPTAPPPIIIPPNPQAPSDPLKNIPQNPRIPPIDLRPAPKPQETDDKKQPSAPMPLPAKTYDGYDPYREPVE